MKSFTENKQEVKPTIWLESKEALVERLKELTDAVNAKDAEIARLNNIISRQAEELNAAWGTEV